MSLFRRLTTRPILEALEAREVPAVVSIQATDPTAFEADLDPAVFTVKRTGGQINQPLTVHYGVGGTATNGTDYQALSGTVVIPAGARTASIIVTPIDDTEVEPTETIVLTLLAGDGYMLSPAMEAKACLFSDDVPATLSLIAVDDTASEAGLDPAQFMVTRDGDLSQPLVVIYSVTGTATPGVDYAALSGSVVIPAGEASAVIDVMPFDDSAVEGTESVVVSLRPGAGYQIGAAWTATVQILDDDMAPPPAPAAPLPVLMVIANQDFYYQEYGDTRAALELAGIGVVVAAASHSLATPHWNSGQGADGGFVMPDLAVADANASDYSAIVFVGGWGSSSYQYAFEGTYAHGAYNPDAAVALAVNALINDFVAQDKYVAAICHGVSVLAWARVDGVSLLEGHTVVAYGGSAPASDVPEADTTRWHVESNGATMLASGSIGDPTTAADDVFISGKIITAENYDSAWAFGQTLAEALLM